MNEKSYRTFFLFQIFLEEICEILYLKSRFNSNLLLKVNSSLNPENLNFDGN